MYWVCAGCEGIVADGLATCPACGGARRPFEVRVGETRVLHLDLLRQPPTWLELRVVEFPSFPAAGLPFRVVAADGAVHDGTLGDDGRIRLDGLAPGTCKVTVYAPGCAPPPWVAPEEDQVNVPTRSDMGGVGPGSGL